jgi:hypothetical protein
MTAMDFSSHPGRRVARLLCLLGLVVVAALWARSYFVEDRLDRRTHHPDRSGGLRTAETSLYSANGRLGLETGGHEYRPGYAARWPGLVVAPATPWQFSCRDPGPGSHYRGSVWNWLGFEDTSLVACGGVTYSSHRRVVPYWSVVALLAAPTAIGAARARLQRRQARLAAGLCL